MPQEQIDIFNKETRPVGFADGNQPHFHTKEDKWFWAMMVACLMKLVLLAKGSNQVPQVLSFSVTDAASVIRDSTSAARVRITNHGPGTVWITYAGNPATPPAVTPIASAIVPQYDSENSPCPVIGQIKARTFAGDTAKITLTIFCA